MTEHVIIGKAHNGTCSLEKYLVDKGFTVVREEQALNRYYDAELLAKYPDHTIHFIYSKVKTPRVVLEKLFKRCRHLDAQVYCLEEMIKEPDFPWENKGNHLTEKGIRPDYTKENPYE